MSQTYRTLSDLMPSQRRRLKLVQPTWVRFTKLDGYQEPRPSEPRHHWVQVPNHFISRGYAVLCDYCAMVMPLDGSHRRLCLGVRRP